jgi:hypothetical protein
MRKYKKYRVVPAATNEIKIVKILKHPLPNKHEVS